MKKAAFIKLVSVFDYFLFVFISAFSSMAAPPQKTTAPAKAEKPKYGGILKDIRPSGWRFNRIPCQKYLGPTLTGREALL